MSLICVLVIHHVMVSVPKHTQTKHGICSPNTRVFFHNIYSKPTENKDETYAYCYHTNHCVIYKSESNSCKEFVSV